MATRNIIDLKAKNADDKVNPRGNSIPSAIAIDPKTLSNEEQLALSSPVSTNTSIQSSTTVEPFGIKSNSIGVYPNDSVQLDIYNANNQYLETNYRITTFIKDSDTVTVDPEKDLSDLGYISGRYRVEYKFNRNYLGSGDAHKLQIQEVSANGLEIRVVPTISSLYSNNDFLSFFESNFFKVSKAQVLPNLLLYKDANTIINVFDYVQDKFTISTTPYSIIFKLNTPLPTGVVVGDMLWLTQQVSETLVDDITIVPPKQKNNTIVIAGPNWDVLAKSTTSVSTQYKDWDDLLSTDLQTSQGVVNQLLSSSLIEGIPLNIDYKEFENYIQFGSATERLLNFRYKMQLVESYDSRIAALTVDLTGLPDSGATGSAYFQSNVLDAKRKKSALLGAMDGYEKYLYYQSSSYVSNSFGEYYPTTWPKSTSTKPYTNYSVTSSQVEDWFDGIIASASLYDTNNDKSLYKLVPAHIQNDPANEGFTAFTHMIGHYFDLVYAYVKQMTTNYNRDESLLEGFSKDLIYHVSQNLGVDFENGSTLDELWSYTLGTDVTGSLSSTYEVTNEDRTKEVWKRVINNLPYLLKTKGTERGVRALINCFGIPQTILRIREYGGSEPGFDSKTDLVYERFNYALQVGYGGDGGVGTYGSGVYGSSSYAYTDPTELISIPWMQLIETRAEFSGGYAYPNRLFPSSIQLRVKMAENQTTDQMIMEVPDAWHIKAFKENGADYIGFFLADSTTSGPVQYATASITTTLYDGTFHSITLKRFYPSDDVTIEQQYDLIVKKVNYEKVVSTDIATLTIPADPIGAYNSSFCGYASGLWIPGSGSYTYAQSGSIALFTGSIQEFRYWVTPLQDAILDNHALTPTSYQGNLADTHTGSTSSFYDLGFRLCLGSDNKKINLQATTSYDSQHPNQDRKTFEDASGVPLAATFYRFRNPIYEPIVEMHSLEWPDLGGNRSVSNKIRIDTTETVGNQLFRDNSIEKPLTDNNPPDSSRLGIYLSPTNEVNQDIAEQFGGLSIDDFIGNPADISLDYYPELSQLQREYLKKYKARNKAQNYIRLLKYYDAALFKMLKNFVPYRANTQVGLLIEPHILDRSKISTKVPTYENLYYTSSITIPDIYTVGGFVEDGGGEPTRDFSGYVPEGVIGGDEAKFVVISGNEEQTSIYTEQLESLQLSPTFEETAYDMVVIDGTQIIQPLTILGNANEFNNTSVADSPSQSGSLTATVDLGISSYGRDIRVEGSQYTFMTYATSGSGPTHSAPYWITSSRYDYSEALNPVIMDSKPSEIANITNDVYDVDIYNKKAFLTSSLYLVPYTRYSASAAIYENQWTSIYGLRIEQTTDENMYNRESPYSFDAYWGFDGTSGIEGGLFFTGGGPAIGYGTYVTGSVKLPAFFYDPNNTVTHGYIYEVTIDISSGEETAADGFEICFGDLDSTITGSMAVVGFGSNLPKTFITKATGPWLGFKVKTTRQGSVPAAQWAFVHTVTVKCLNYRAQVQDFHLQDSYGMRNARYDGCKLTSADWNVDSTDTSDGGPVVTITVGGGNELTAIPNNRGNFQIR